jgi:hypothetical protein
MMSVTKKLLMLSDIMLNGIMLSAIILNVMAPRQSAEKDDIVLAVSRGKKMVHLSDSIKLFFNCKMILMRQ